MEDHIIMHTKEKTFSFYSNYIDVKYLQLFDPIEINKWRQYKTGDKIFGSIWQIRVKILHIILIHSRHDKD